MDFVTLAPLMERTGGRAEIVFGNLERVSKNLDSAVRG